MKYNWIKNCMYATGYIAPNSIFYSLECIYNHASNAKWWKSKGYQPQCTVSSRDAIFTFVNDIIGDRKALYLEFGVYYGYTMRLCSKLMQNPNCQLHGFDSFHGLPEAWNARYGAGSMSMNGLMPAFDDPRIHLYKGWFENILPYYNPPDHDIMFINCDADLFTSTSIILEHINKWLKPNDLIYFDEFHHNAGERLAFDIYSRKIDYEFIPLAATYAKNHVLWKVK